MQKKSKKKNAFAFLPFPPPNTHHSYCVDWSPTGVGGGVNQVQVQGVGAKFRQTAGPKARGRGRQHWGGGAGAEVPSGRGGWEERVAAPGRRGYRHRRPSRQHCGGRSAPTPSASGPPRPRRTPTPDTPPQKKSTNYRRKKREKTGPLTATWLLSSCMAINSALTHTPQVPCSSPLTDPVS